MELLFTSMSTEWDLRFTLPFNNWKRAAKTIKNNVDTKFDPDNTEYEYMMMSGVEYGKTGHEDAKSYHIHCGLITKSPITGYEAKRIFLNDERVTNISPVCVASWSCKRDPNKTYRGWYIHHVKSKMKVEGGYGVPLLAEWNDIPEDVHSQLNADKILAVTREYSPERLTEELATIQSWNAGITFKKYRMLRSDEERILAKKEYLRLYRANPINKKRKTNADQQRKITQYKKLRTAYEVSNPASDEASALYCHLKILEGLTYVRTSIDEEGMELVPVHEFA